MINLSPRLEAISSLIPINTRIVDIGCDHGYLGIYLYQKGICSKIIASDVNANALENAKENIVFYHLEENIETRLGNGLDVINEDDNIDTLIISGMGTHTIIGILKNNYHKLKNINNIIIQSNTKIELLRKEVIKLNYYIDNEILVKDNKKIYTAIRFIKGKKKYNHQELYFGPVLLNKQDNLFNEYYGKELEKLKICLNLLPSNHLKERYKIKKEIRLYKNIIKK